MKLNMSQEPRTKPRYWTLLIWFIIYIIFWVIIIGIMQKLFKPTFPLRLSRLVPLNDIYQEIAFIFIIILPLSAVFGVFIGGYLITPLILTIHKNFFGIKKYYGIQPESSSVETRLMTKGFFPVLMAINLSSLFLTPTIMEFILSADILIEFDGISKVPVFTKFLAESVLLILTFGLAILLFSSVWFLKDSGIIYSNKEKVVNSNESIVFRSIGEWFQTILRSYAGIGAVITYIVVVQDFITRFINNYGLPGNILNIPSLVLWLGMPFYLVLSLIPAIIFNDLIKRNRVKYIRNIGRKLGIKGSAIISFEFKEDK